MFHLDLLVEVLARQGKSPTVVCCLDPLQVNVEMEDNAIPEEYFSCHADQLFDLLASSLLDFAKRHGRYCFILRCLEKGSLWQ